MGGSLVCVQHRGSPAARASPVPSPAWESSLTEAQAGLEGRAGSGNTQKGQAGGWELSHAVPVPWSTPVLSRAPPHLALRKHSLTTGVTWQVALIYQGPPTLPCPQRLFARNLEECFRG